MLCHTLRRLFRSRTNQSFRGLQEYAELFTGAHCDLATKGEQVFSAELTDVDIQKQRKRQVIRKALISM